MGKKRRAKPPAQNYFAHFDRGDFRVANYTERYSRKYQTCHFYGATQKELK
jgi:hypothetical protein